MPFELPEGWCWTSLQEISLLIEDCPHTTAKDEGVGYPLVRTPNIGEGYLILDGVHRVCEEIYNKRNVRAIPQTNDIVYAREAPAGNAAVIKEDEKICLGQRTVLIRPAKNYVDSNLLAYFILSPYSRNRLISKATGSTVQHVNMESIRPHLIPLPPYNEQIKISNRIKELNAIVDELAESETAIQQAVLHTKSKILELAIHGKLVPQEASDEPALELLKRINPKAIPSCDNPHYEQIPAGWCFCTLEDIINYEQPQAYIVHSTDYSDFYEVPVLTAGKSFIVGYTDEQDGIYENVPVIIFDDFTTDSKYVDFPFKVKSSAMKILHVKEGINTKYVAYFMSVTRLIGDTHKRYWISEYSKVNIPLPPKAEQDRIVIQIERMMSSLDSIAGTLV